MLIPFWLRDEPPRQVSEEPDASAVTTSAETLHEELHEERESHQEDDDELTDQTLARRDPE
jgi:hypothetical protein